MRTQEEIQRQIAGLEAEKFRLPEVSTLGTPNHEIADAKIEILQGGELSDVEEGNWEEVDDQNEIYRGAEEANEWMKGDRDEDLFEED